MLVMIEHFLQSLRNIAERAGIEPLSLDLAAQHFADQLRDFPAVQDSRRAKLESTIKQPVFGQRDRSDLGDVAIIDSRKASVC